MHRVFIADDHALFREGLKTVLSRRSDFEIAGEAGNGFELLGILKKDDAPEVVILDISMPGMGGIEAISGIKISYPQARVLVLTMHKDEEQLCQAFMAGADGYLLKEDVAKELFCSLETILRGEFYVSPLLGEALRKYWVQIFSEKKGLPWAEPLSRREREVLKLVADGKSNKEIAEALCISVRTVEHHRSHIMDKLNIKSTHELVRYAVNKHYI